jgi:tryptophan synthase alpha chain
MGVTGARSETSVAAPELVRRIRDIDGTLPIGVGLGVSNGDQAASVGSAADGVIVGSALVSTLLAAEAAGTPSDLTALRALVSDLAAGVRRAGRP